MRRLFLNNEETKELKLISVTFFQQNEEILSAEDFLNIDIKNYSIKNLDLSSKPARTSSRAGLLTKQPFILDLAQEFQIPFLS